MKQSMVIFLYFSIILMALVSCQQNTAEKATVQEDTKIADEFEKLAWINGSWIREKKGKTTLEVWQKINETKMTGVSYRIQNADTTVLETLELVKKDDGVYYIPTVSHNAGPVPFKMTAITDMEAVFENPAHDFPTKIIYRKISADSLHARIEGQNNGETVGVDFFFARK